MENKTIIFSSTKDVVKGSNKKVFKTVIVALIILFVNSAIMLNGGAVYLKNVTIEHGLFIFFLIITLMNIFIQPVSTDFIIAGSSYFLHTSLTSIMLISVVSSLCSAIICYYLGSRIGQNEFERCFGLTNTKKVIYWYQKHGLRVVILSVFLPVPYSLVCWTAGIFRMQFLPFFLTIIFTRVPRYILVSYYGKYLIDYITIL